jgi:putative restriction endonuclease
MQPVDDTDLRVRLAAFEFLTECRRQGTDLFSRDVLAQGFTLEGQRVPLLGPQGIFKPRVCRRPLSITTVPTREGQARPYEDAFGEDGLLRYRYRGPEHRPVPDHPDNVGLREAQRLRTPLIYFHGIVPGRYAAEYPVYIVGDDRTNLTFTVTVDERRFATLGSVDEEPDETAIRRRYATRVVQQRLHQQEFRERVLEAYLRHSAICRLKRDRLLEAAHIIGDGEELGVPVVANGVALCSLHHAAFDAHLIAIRPDYQIEVRRDVLEEIDGPMLVHGLQGFNGQPIRVPRAEQEKPDRRLLELRYEQFQLAAS